MSVRYQIYYITLHYELMRLLMPLTLRGSEHQWTRSQHNGDLAALRPLKLFPP